MAKKLQKLRFYNTESRSFGNIRKILRKYLKNT